MIELSKQNLLRTVREYIIISIGISLYAFAWMGIVLPAGLVGGGVSGMSMLLFYGFEIPLTYSMFAINGVFLTVAYFIIGAKFSTKTIYAVSLLSFMMGFMQRVLPVDLVGLCDDKFLSVILGGTIAGFGTSLCFSQGGSTGGTDIIAMIINKYKTVSYGKVIMYCDFCVIGLSYFIKDDITTVIYSFVLVSVFGYTLDMFLAGNKQSSQVLIVSKNHKVIAERVYDEIGRGVTLLNGEGWYSKDPMKIVMVVCRKNEMPSLLRVVKEYDPNAFITVGSVMGVYGLGFEPLRK